MKKTKEQYVYEVFQSIAEGYDSANRRISLMQHMRWKKAAAKMLCASLPAGGRVLDIGCGTGDMLQIIAKEKPDALLTGIDFSPNMLKAAGERTKDIPKVKLIRGNAMHLPFENESYDGVMISFALRNTEDYGRVLSEAFRVLNKRGCFVCIDSFVPENRIIKPFYGLYFTFLMPLLGGGTGKLKEYRWLNKSTAEFISASRLGSLMKKTGFCRIKMKSFLFGACIAVRGIVPGKPVITGNTGKGKDV